MRRCLVWIYIRFQSKEGKSIKKGIWIDIWEISYGNRLRNVDIKMSKFSKRVLRKYGILWIISFGKYFWDKELKITNWRFMGRSMKCWFRFWGLCYGANFWIPASIEYVGYANQLLIDTKNAEVFVVYCSCEISLMTGNLQWKFLFHKNNVNLLLK